MLTSSEYRQISEALEKCSHEMLASIETARNLIESMDVEKEPADEYDQKVDREFNPIQLQ